MLFARIGAVSRAAVGWSWEGDIGLVLKFASFSSFFNFGTSWVGDVTPCSGFGELV